jgi:hypothetical protein
MPPCTWMFSIATDTYAREQYTCAATAAAGKPGSWMSCRRAASRPVASASSTSASMSAHLCLTAWNEPTGRPNWYLVRA